MNALGWGGIRMIGSYDSDGAWYPRDDVAAYFSAIRMPSRAWPHSYAKAAQTKKFASWLINNRPELAAQLGITS